MTITYSVDGGKTYQALLMEGVTNIKWDVIDPIYAGESVAASFQVKMGQ